MIRIETVTIKPGRYPNYYGIYEVEIGKRKYETDEHRTKIIMECLDNWETIIDSGDMWLSTLRRKSDLDCDGDCAEHIGVVLPVIVYNGAAKLHLNYCENAIKEDHARRLTVLHAVPYTIHTDTQEAR